MSLVDSHSDIPARLEVLELFFVRTSQVSDYRVPFERRVQHSHDTNRKFPPNMELNNERLIVEVQKYPCLYNIDHEEYRNKELKNLCWVIVAQRVLNNEKWDELSDLETKRISKEVQKRWKNLRDAYTRALRSQMERGGSKPYIYEKQMSFLLPGPASQRNQVPIKEEPEENLVICEPDVNTTHLDDTQDFNDRHSPSFGESE
ncbi:hypothetical protein GE061_012669, partial [Apolygus lucorum]